MLPSEPIEANIRDRAEKLESFYDKIMGCRVLVEAPHHHHRAGQRYHVRIDLTVPGQEIVISGTKANYRKVVAFAETRQWAGVGREPGTQQIRRP